MISYLLSFAHESSSQKNNGNLYEERISLQFHAFFALSIIDGSHVHLQKVEYFWCAELICIIIYQQCKHFEKSHANINYFLFRNFNLWKNEQTSITSSKNSTVTLQTNLLLACLRSESIHYRVLRAIDILFNWNCKNFRHWIIQKFKRFMYSFVIMKFQTHDFEHAWMIWQIYDIW